MPPLWTVTYPAMPPARTSWPPSATVMARTESLDVTANVVPEATRAVPPPLTVRPLAVPPDSTIRPPLRTVVPTAVP